ncbi:MAG: U32 family peptidase [Candidatus Aenigmarchaeota archaeon]|nr:U32 family peptidase [Candidatus Aenigmarchaeota archaeon]
MPDFRFSVPYNNDPTLLKKLVGLQNINGNRIEGIYLSGPREIYSSGRTVSEISLRELMKVIRFCHKKELKVDLAINSTCEGRMEYSIEHVSKTLKFLKTLHEGHGLDGVIVANPAYIQTIKKELPGLSIAASAFSDIDSFEKARFFKKIGADTLTLNGLNRDFRTLEEIKKLGIGLRIMANEGCIWKCPLRQFHNNFTSHASKEGNISIDPCAESCIGLRKFYPELIITSDWILPQWLAKYGKITRDIKIVGRTMESKWILQRVMDYLHEEYAGNILDLLESAIPMFNRRFNWYISSSHFDEAFFKKVTSCNKNCFVCHYCRDIAKKSIENLSHIGNG